MTLGDMQDRSDLLDTGTATSRGLEVSSGCLLQNELVQRQVGDRLAKTGILRLERLMCNMVSVMGKSV